VAARTPPLITLTTDFGTDDVFVGVMKGVILGINPAVRVVDLTHGVPAQAVEIGALLLRLAAPYFPARTIHVAVVDPGVGGARRAVCVETARGIFVGPDNGLLVPAAEDAGIRRVVACTNDAFFLPAVGPTFHGRDVFAPVAAHLSRGVRPTRLGPTAAPLTPLALARARREGNRIAGEVIHVDRFGNLITNVSAGDLEGFPRQTLSVSIGAFDLRGLVSSYGVARDGELVVLVNSWGLLEVAERNGSAAGRSGVGRGAPVVVTRGTT
jgi:S-adenosylmethionine hydrolase